MVTQAGIACGMRSGIANANVYNGRSAARITSEAFDRKYFAVSNEFPWMVFDADNLIADLECYIFHGIVSLIQITAKPL